MTPHPRRILVPTDFSETADHALALARRLAVRFAAEIHLLHVRILLEDPHLVEEQQREFERLLTRSDQKTREMLGRQTPGDAVVVHPHLVRGMSASESILEATGDLGCDLVIMGTHGRRGIKHLLIGSVAEQVVRTAPVPVLTIRADASISDDPISRILVPFDFSDGALAAVELAGGWAQALHAQVTLLHVVEPVVYPEFYAVDLLPDEMLGHIQERSTKALDELAAERLPGIPVTSEIAVGRAAETIVETAEPARHDLLIVSTRGLSGIEHLLLGSVAEGVIRRARIPVVTVRSEED